MAIIKNSVQQISSDKEALQSNTIKTMKKAFITYALLSIAFSLFCLICVVLPIITLFSKAWEETLFIASALNLGLTFTYYHNHKHELRGKSEKDKHRD